MTGLAGGGHALWWDARERPRDAPRLLRRGARPRAPSRARSSSLQLEVPFGAELVHYAVGIGSCGVPGVPAGPRRALAAPRPPPLGAPRRAGDPDRAGRRPDAARARRLPRDARAGHDDARGRGDLHAGRAPARGRRRARPARARARLRAPRRRRRPLVLRRRAGRSRSSASWTSAAGSSRADDLEAYRPRWSEPAEGRYAGRRVLTRGGLAGLVPALARAPALRGALAGRAGRRARRGRSAAGRRRRAHDEPRHRRRRRATPAP